MEEHKDIREIAGEQVEEMLRMVKGKRVELRPIEPWYYWFRMKLWFFGVRRWVALLICPELRE